ncbi:MAG: pantetheine-phosphate adenylyltransferase [Nitrospinae bacterium]|nr:pantetheine-phosphate adenylyltransferase [Nitrospinota bacterium]
MEKVRALYPGTFDPVSNGHIDLIRRGGALFDEIIVGVARNERKKPFFPLDERARFIREACADIPNLMVVPFSCLLVDFARQQGARVILKGLRAVSDFDYELQMSLINRRLAPDIETVFMMPSEEFSFVSSTMIKEVSSLGGDVSSIVPPNVLAALSERLRGSQ